LILMNSYHIRQYGQYLQPLPQENLIAHQGYRHPPALVILPAHQILTLLILMRSVRK
jgi:hypothetical protein